MGPLYDVCVIRGTLGDVCISWGPFHYEEGRDLSRKEC